MEKKSGGDKSGERAGYSLLEMIPSPNYRNSLRIVARAYWYVELSYWNHAFNMSSSVRCPRN
jgi:hypothetical protein